MVLVDRAHPTITGSIRAGILDPTTKKRYCYLEVQEAHEEDYEVVDSWSNDSLIEC